VFAIATGIDEHKQLRGRLHRGDALDQGASCRTRKSPAAFSNVSFSFRGNEPVRESDPHGVPLSRDQGPA